MSQTLVEDVLQGRRRAIARMLTMVENEREGADDALAALFPHTGHGWVVGITGAPGTGKSTLVNALAKALREGGSTVGIIAVDPTSPFSGGAILGDRIRMRDLSGDDGVFIRSMATRGSLGGLAKATRDAIRVLDAAGFDYVLVETVGAGQSEVDIVRTAHTTIVIEAPGLGDDVQAIKAGILEIADVLVVNKADRPGAQHTVRSLRAMIEMGHPAARSQMVSHHGSLMQVDHPPTGNLAISDWIPPIIETVAKDSKGIELLIDAIQHHRQHLIDTGSLRDIDHIHIEIELYERLRETLMTRLRASVPQEAFAQMIERIQKREIDPQRAVADLLRESAFWSTQQEST